METVAHWIKVSVLEKGEKVEKSLYKKGKKIKKKKSALMNYK